MLNMAVIGSMDEHTNEQRKDGRIDWSVGWYCQLMDGWTDK